MKALYCLQLLFVTSLAFEMSAGTFSHSSNFALYKVWKYGALAKECLRVVDQDGCPVAGARVWGGLQTGGNLNDFTAISGYTNTNGEYVIEGKCTNRIRCDITKVGYYPSELCLSNYGYSHSVSNGVWIPYGEMRVVTLKKKGSSVPFTVHSAMRSRKAKTQSSYSIGALCELHARCVRIEPCDACGRAAGGCGGLRCFAVQEIRLHAARHSRGFRQDGRTPEAYQYEADREGYEGI